MSFFFTKNRYGDLVVISIEIYEAMLENAATDWMINKAEAKLGADDQSYNAKEVLGSIGRKHFILSKSAK